jgi:CPA2 family monovalent cation:H+ antiporter-2
VLGVLAVFIGLANLLELPLVAGAFLAGVGMSAFPLRGILRPQLSSVGDFFSAIFFIALGGLLQSPSAAELMQVLAFTVLVIVVTPPLVAFLAQRAGLPARAATEAGLILAQTSELSLVLALQGMISGHLTQEVFTVLALVTVITMVLTPAVSSRAVMERAMRLQPVRPAPAAEAPHGHVLLLGCGSGGMPLLETLFAGGEGVVVIEDDPQVVDRLRRGDVHTIRGDAAEIRTLIEAGAAQARMISSTIRRPRDNQALLEMVRDVPVLVRVFEEEDAEWVRQMGGTPIVYSAAAAEDFLAWFDRAFRPETARPQPIPTERDGTASGM